MEVHRSADIKSVLTNELCRLMRWSLSHDSYRIRSHAQTVQNDAGIVEIPQDVNTEG